MLEPFTPPQKLHAAIRRRVPQIACAMLRDEKAGLTRVRVTYRHSEPLEIEWDVDTYRWLTGPDKGKSLTADPEAAADAVADKLGASRVSPSEAEEARA
ncbi:hypothetical protein ACFHW2_11670 [Actinomadura sp. LOL_016]|uniref:hypothetical protein n=1 Tax=unclassified Actinomadura TaxID=2626254 RepID=UPI003A811E67